MSTKSLIKSTSLIGVATAISRVLGFVRDVLIAGFFGTGSLIQAFFVAFRIPNLMRDMVGEGAMNSAFVPVLSEYLATKKKEDYWQASAALFNIMTVVLAVIILLGIVFSPFIVRIIAPGFMKDLEQFNLAVKLTKIMFPFIFFIGLAALTAGVLNSLRHFSAPAFASSFLNISLILTMLFFHRRVDVFILSIAVLIGGISQLIFQAIVLYKKGMRIKIPLKFFHPAAKKAGILLIPRILGTTVYQLNVLVDTMLASLYWIVGKGGIAALYYSNRLIQFPTAIVGIALATAALPALSTYFATNELGKFKNTISFSLKCIFLFMIPISVGVMIIGKPIVELLFQRGQFDSYSTYITNQALFFYSIGLFSYSGIKILAFSFYSMQDTITPVKTAAIALVINIVLNLILMWPLKIGGLALATSISATTNFALLFYFLRKKTGYLVEKEILGFSFKVITASFIMGCALFFMSKITMCASALAAEDAVLKTFAIFASVLTSVLVYIAALLLLDLGELKEMFRWIRKR